MLLLCRLGTSLCGNNWVPDINAANSMGLTPVQLAAAAWVPAAACLQLMQLLRCFMAEWGAAAVVDAAWAMPAGSTGLSPSQLMAARMAHSGHMPDVLVVAHGGSVRSSDDGSLHSDDQTTQHEMMLASGAEAAVAASHLDTNRSSIEVAGQVVGAGYLDTHRSSIELRRLQPLPSSAGPSTRASAEYQQYTPAVAAQPAAAAEPAPAPAPAAPAAPTAAQASEPQAVEDHSDGGSAAVVESSRPLSAAAVWVSTCKDGWAWCTDAAASWLVKTAGQEEAFQAWVRGQVCLNC